MLIGNQIIELNVKKSIKVEIIEGPIKGKKTIALKTIEINTTRIDVEWDIKINGLFGIFTEGMPGHYKIAGFAFAATGIYLVSRPDEHGHPEEVTSAALAAIGFAGYFLFIKQAGEGSSVFWIAGLSRFASFVLTLMIVLAGRGRSASKGPASTDSNGTDSDGTGSDGMDARTIVFGVLAGFMDISGSALFSRASQAGRMDVAVVLSSLYPAITVVLAGIFLHERFTRWKLVGLLAALAAVPLIAA